MPVPTPELGLLKGVDADDTADYLVTSLANSLGTVDSLFNNVSGHTHNGAHQGGPISIPTGTITSLMIADGTIQTQDIALAATTNVVGVYQAIPGFSTTTVNSYVSTPISVSGPYSGVNGSQILAFCTFSWSHSGPAGSYIYASLLLDSSPQGGLACGMVAIPGQVVTTTLQLQHTPSAAGHTWTLGLYNNSAGTLALNNAVDSSLFVLEIKR